MTEILGKDVYAVKKNEDEDDNDKSQSQEEYFPRCIDIHATFAIEAA